MSQTKKIETQQEEQIVLEPEEQSFEEVSVGQILKNKRQKLKIEIEDVAAYLKMKLRDIEALENDDLSSIIKHLYLPGLLRSYARFLKIDQRIIEEKIKLLHIESNTNNKKHQLLNIGENIDLTPDNNVFLNFLAVSVLLFFILLSIYNFSENKSPIINSDILVEELKKIDL